MEENTNQDLQIEEERELTRIHSQLSDTILSRTHRHGKCQRHPPSMTGGEGSSTLVTRLLPIQQGSELKDA